MHPHQKLAIWIWVSLSLRLQLLSEKLAASLSRPNQLRLTLIGRRTKLLEDLATQLKCEPGEVTARHVAFVLSRLEPNSARVLAIKDLATELHIDYQAVANVQTKEGKNRPKANEPTQAPAFTGAD